MHERGHKDLRILRLIATGLSLILGGSVVQGLSLTDRSPFIPEGFTPNKANASAGNKAGSNQPLEFRGMYKLNDNYYFLVSQRNSKGKWLSMGESEDGLTVQEFEADEDRLLVEHNGKPVWLELSEMATLTGKPVTTRPAVATTRRTSTVPARTTRTTSSSTSSRRTVIRPTTGSSGRTVTSRSGTRSTRTRYPGRTARSNPRLKLPTEDMAPVPPAPVVPAVQPPVFDPGAPPPANPDDNPFN